MQVCALYS